MNKYKELIQNSLEKYFEQYAKNASYDKNIWKSMAYTTLLDGKRLRAVMALEIAKIFGVKQENILPFACALEMMHAYSLIHDDLPCMDNDDLRRGKPSNHKVFGEACALLAGDALISFGAQLIIEQTPDEVSSDVKLEAVLDYLRCAGAQGLVAGQIADIEAEDKKIDIENLKYIHKYKTGALFKCAIVTPLKYAHANEDIIKKMEQYAQNFGLLFQIYDDIIDCTLSSDELGKTAGKDSGSNKLTYVSAYGLEEAQNIFYSLIESNYDIMSDVKIESQIFKQIYEMLISKIRR